MGLCAAAPPLGRGAKFAWASRFRRLTKDYERLSETLIGLHFVAFVCLLLQKAGPLLQVHNTLQTHYTFRRPSSYVLQIVSASANMETWECPRGLDARSAIWWLPGDGGVSAGTYLTGAERG